jgi:hypothetical protein
MRTKTIRIGKGKYGNVYCKITQEKDRLSIYGVVGPMKNGDCRGSCGQINMSFDIDSITEFVLGWNKEQIERFMKVWDRWHLNDMRAGTLEQEQAIREWKEKGNKYTYQTACEYLKSVGLYEVNDEGKTYKYGYEWKFEQVPSEVWDYLFNELPDTDIIPAWV